jgi:30S ribosomal protein S31
MGKGDKKTAKGKRVIGSYGNVRKRKPSASALAAKVSTEKAEKPAAEKKPAAKKASTAKKTTTKKATSETE